MLCGVVQFVLALTITAAAAATTLSDYYTAGVVEFRPTTMGMSSADMLAEHLHAYIDIIYSADANATDIIVFPEGTLNNALQLTYVPAAHQMIIPCEQQQQQQHNAIEYANFLVQLSCAARDARKYLVINLTEKEDCNVTAALDPRPCASTGLNIYNTNVVFDREGRIISRYRKVHVYLEAKNTTYEPEFAIFETDFGVRFGHFICFDILFYTPAEELIVRYDVKDIIFTSLFYSELPFLTAVQLQHAWSWGNNVNLLAAGASYPKAGTTGSGIYAGSEGDLVSLMARGDGVRKLLVAQVPKRRERLKQTKNMIKKQNIEIKDTRYGPEKAVVKSDIKLMRDPQIEAFKSQLIDFTETQEIKTELCDGDLCCTFHVEAAAFATMSRNDSFYYKYRIGVFKGERTYEKAEWSNLRICALYACSTEDSASCGIIYDMPESVQQHQVNFTTIQIEGEFLKTNRLLIMPNTLADSLYPLKAQFMDWHVMEHDKSFHAELRLKNTADNILTFAIYANYYDKSAALKTAEYSLLMLWSSIIFIICFRYTRMQIK